MFKGLYDLIHKNKKNRSQNKVLLKKEALQILSPTELLMTEKRQQVLHDIRSLLDLPDKDYERIFLSVIYHFAAFVQNIPETERSYYSSLGGILDHGLERTSLSLLLCRTYLLPEGASLLSLSKQELLWVYAVFTAALLLDVGKIVTRHTVALTDAEGLPLSVWLPYSGLMLGQAKYYTFEFAEDNTEHMRSQITPLLARQILSLQGTLTENQTNQKQEETFQWVGFNWLASDPDVLESWLAMLSDEQRSVGSLLTVIPLADAQLLEEYFTDRKVFRHALSPQKIAFLNRLKKERKALSEKLKILKEKMLAEQTKRTGENINHKDTFSDQAKTSTQSLFGFSSLTQPGKDSKIPLTVTTSLTDAMVRRCVEHFSQWMKKSLEQGALVINHDASGVHVIGKTIVLTERLLASYLKSHPDLDIKTIKDLSSVLAKGELMRVISPAEMVKLSSAFPTMSHFTHVLAAQNPALILPVGLAHTFQTIHSPQSSLKQEISNELETGRLQGVKHSPHIFPQ